VPCDSYSMHRSTAITEEMSPHHPLTVPGTGPPNSNAVSHCNGRGYIFWGCMVCGGC